MWQDLFIGGKDWEAYWLPQKSCHTFPHFFHHTIRHRAALSIRVPFSVGLVE
jgi:hypothetical protein